MGSLRITQIKSQIGSQESQRATLRSLGLRKVNQHVVRPDNAAVRGMIHKVRHLVLVEEDVEA